MKKIGKIFAGIFAILFCGGLSTIFSHDFSFLNTPKTAEISGRLPGGGGAEPLIDPSKGSSPQKNIILPTDRDLPEGFLQLEFIQSSGAYIDTGVLCNKTSLRIEVDFQYIKTSNNTYVAGAQWSGQNSNGCRIGIVNNEFHTNNNRITYSQTDLWERTQAIGTVGQTNEYSILLFGIRWNNSPSNMSNSRIYSAQIYDGDDLIRDFVPCFNIEEKEFGMYEKQDGIFYGNAGASGYLCSNWVDPTQTIVPKEQYFIDQEMTENTTTTITGTGAADDPYVLNSSEDFWWASKYLNCSNKFVELGCDVFLNEEKYDENGNVLAGTSADGRVYCYTTGFSSSNESFDGKNHKVYGCYVLNPSSSVSLLGDVQRVENLSIDDFYFETNKTRYASVKGICNKSTTIINNCHTLHGVLRGSPTILNNFVSAIGDAEQYIGNCTNHANIYNPWQDSSVIGNCSNGIIENCTNYGNVVKGGAYVSGIGKAKKHINCVNYGDIESRYTGGIASVGGRNCVLEGCKNFGKMMSSYAGGLVGDIYPGAITVIFRNCEVDCKEADNVMFGGLGLGTETTMIESCKIKLYSNQSIIYNSSKGSYINNCEIEYVDYNNGSYKFNVCVKNTIIKVNAVSGLANKYKRVRLYNNSNTANMKNIYIETDFDLYSTSLFNTNNGDPKCLDGIIVKTPTQKFYYGNDFSAYHVDWKTGALGQSWKASLGFFQARVDVATLEKMGYERRTA